jgi:hypothetical protein
VYPVRTHSGNGPVVNGGVLAGVCIVVALLALLPLPVVVGRLTRLHHHRMVEGGVHSCGVDHVGNWDVCWCGAARMVGDRKWQRRPAALNRN